MAWYSKIAPIFLFTTVTRECVGEDIFLGFFCESWPLATCCYTLVLCHANFGEGRLCDQSNAKWGGVGKNATLKKRKVIIMGI